MSAPSPQPVPYVDLGAQYAEERDELLPLVDRMLASGAYVGGAAIDELEARLAKLCHVRHAVALASGTDALILAMRALGLGPGDEVITPPNSFVASTAAIVHVGATPVFADIRDDQNIDPERVAAAVTPRTRAIMPVHLTGRISDMDPIMEIARDRNLFVIEDAAQAIASTYRDRPAGSLGHIGCFSCHPLKNLNAAGDGGFLTTDDDKIAAAVRSMRNHGLVDRNTVERFGFVSRMDTLQAVVLGCRLNRLDDLIRRRRAHVELYRSLLDPRHVFWPPERQIEFNTYHTFVVQVDRRDELQRHLAERGIGTAIHYPIPIHLQPAAQNLGYKRGDFPVTERQAERIIALPIHQTLKPDQIREVAAVVNRFLTA